MSRPFMGKDGIPSAELHAHLTTIRHSVDAARVEVTNDTPSPQSIYRLPLFLAGTNIAINWNVPLIGALANDATITAQWTAWDRSTGDMEGSYVLQASGVIVTAGHPGITCEISRPLNRRMLARELERISRAGNQAIWTLIDKLRPTVERLVGIASSHISNEITDGESCGGVIDQVEIEAIADTYLIGEDGPDLGLFSRLLHRAASDLESTVGDRYTYIIRNVKSAVESAVRRKIGDPRDGRVIRRFLRDVGAELNAAEVIALWSEMHPDRPRLTKYRLELSHSAAGTLDSAAAPFYEASDSLEFSTSGGLP